MRSSMSFEWQFSILDLGMSQISQFQNSFCSDSHKKQVEKLKIDQNWLSKQYPSNSE